MLFICVTVNRVTVFPFWELQNETFLAKQLALALLMLRGLAVSRYYIFAQAPRGIKVERRLRP